MSICVAPVDVVQVHSWWASEHSCGCQPKCTAELNLNRSVSQMSNSSLTISLSGVEISSQKAFKAKCNLCPLSKLSGAVRSCAVLTSNFCVFSISEFGNPNTNRPQMLATVFFTVAYSVSRISRKSSNNFSLSSNCAIQQNGVQTDEFR